MRNLCIASLFLMMVGGLFAQDQPPSGGRFYGPLFPKSQPPAQQPTLKLYAPFAGAVGPTNVVPTNVVPPKVMAGPLRCAVPLIQMKVPAGTDPKMAMMSPPKSAAADRMEAKPPAPACTTP